MTSPKIKIKIDQRKVVREREKEREAGGKLY